MDEEYIQPPTMTVIEPDAQEPSWTGLYGADGLPIYRVPHREPLGFVHFVEPQADYVVYPLSDSE
ncbi:MAG: hypothetical protein AB1698_01575 [Pseudomonadota bacterium]